MEKYDVLVLGTGVAEAVLGAALSRAGKKVLQVDENKYYGSSWASLTLKELLKWSEEQNATVQFPRDGQLSDALLALDRHYSLSLRPTLLPAFGPTIEALVRSNVASYATFRLLDRVAVYEAESHRLQSVPASKSDIFRNKQISLADKRRLMRFLQIALEPSQPNHPAEAATPSSEQPALLADVLKHLQIAERLQSAVQYGVCLAWNSMESTDSALHRTRRALKGLGRYGDSAYLVGQYGGAGELAQGFCRAAAVKGATFVLGHSVQSLDYADGQWVLHLDGVDEVFTATQLACPTESLNYSMGKAAQFTEHKVYEHMAIIITDAPIDWQQVNTDTDVLETSLLVFPPGTVPGIPNNVMVLMQGEGTFSCPKGQYVYHLITYAEKAQTVNMQGACDLLMQLLEPRSDACNQPTKNNEEKHLGESHEIMKVIDTDGKEPDQDNETEHHGPTTRIPILTLFHTRPLQSGEQPISDNIKCDFSIHAGAYTNTNCSFASKNLRSSLCTDDIQPQSVPNLMEILDIAVIQAEEAFWQLYPSELRQNAELAIEARKRIHQPSDYQGRGGVEPDHSQVPTYADVEFFAPESD
ncbi:hypothetical protein MYAM1_000495 [Malassezia yamatoensis]|uniref:Rab proteins geranylgeranyltransferase component A n=1 Tax=Malassezia yamatoensis TaxID=253288 RepID=A0AAJ5YS41_9BASI|nr:hypothetical protein MYAM1_000495 [Malassezia yamatoensis]